jgi:hypothetical protein
LRNATAAPVAGERAAELVIEEAAEAIEVPFKLDMTFSVTEYATDTGTVYETKRCRAANTTPTRNCVICIVVRVRLMPWGTRKPRAETV